MNKHTLDLEHKLHLQKMRQARESIDSARTTLESIQSDAGAQISSFDLLRKRHRVECARSELASLDRASDGLGYHLRAGSTLFKYYDIAEGSTMETGGIKPTEPKNSVLSYFESKSKAPESSAGPTADVAACTKAGLMETFLKLVGGGDTHGPGDTEGGACTHCGSKDTVTYVLESQRVCCDCDAVDYVVLDNERPGTGNMPKDGSVFHFKRTNHLMETINSSEGKEHATIPDAVFGTILTELKKQKITNMVDVTKEQVKAILKKTHLSKYYEHCSYIVSQLSGKPTEPFPPALVQQFIKMFVQVQPPFIKHAPPDRKNFLSYNYVLYKFCELLERDEYLDRFSLLKSGDKLSGQDKIWRKICEELGWQYIPTI